MALHWDTFELRIRDSLNIPSEGQVQQVKLARWANEAIDTIPIEAQIAKARIVIYFNNGLVTLLEEDWPGTETIGPGQYTYGRRAAFYIRDAESIDAIHEMRQRDTGDDDACGDPIYAYDWLYPMLELKRQEHITMYAGVSDFPTAYGVYRDTIYTPRSPADDPRPLTEPFEVLAVWFDPMFDYSAATFEKWYQVQYRRRIPKINLTLIGSPSEYTQPYFFIREGYDKLILFYVRAQVMFSLHDNRWQQAAAEYEKYRRMLKWSRADRGSVDRGPRLEDPDAHIIRQGRIGDLDVDSDYRWQWG